MADLAAIFDSPICRLGIEIEHDYLIAIRFLSEKTASIKPNSSLAKEVVSQLRAYFDKRTYRFDLPLRLLVTDFQHKVLGSLSLIPFGATETYGNLANQLDTSPRAIGNACRKNPIPIIVPCHRVLARNQIGGYCGAMSGKFLAIKKWLLNHEANYGF
jgi:methylated-DNA-[protein]-cysteine S-methyltransferase